MSEATQALKAKPVLGGVLGIIAGLAIAVVLQQQGVWPLDRILVFLLTALIGGLGVLLGSIGRATSTGSLATMLVILGAMAVWGALGLAAAGERGQLNGGCTVSASSPIDSTVVTDTSRGNPFALDPDGGVSWTGTSPTVFQDFEWEVWVDFAGFPVVLESGFEENDDEDTTTSGSEPNVTAYGEAQGIPMDELRGVFIVGGFAASCDGFAFLELVSDGFLETTAAKIAAAVAVIALIALIAIAMGGRRGDTTEASPQPDTPF